MDTKNNLSKIARTAKWDQELDDRCPILHSCQRQATYPCPRMNSWHSCHKSRQKNHLSKCNLFISNLFIPRNSQSSQRRFRTVLPSSLQSQLVTLLITILSLITAVHGKGGAARAGGGAGSGKNISLEFWNPPYFVSQFKNVLFSFAH